MCKPPISFKATSSVVKVIMSVNLSRRNSLDISRRNSVDPRGNEGCNVLIPTTTTLSPKSAKEVVVEGKQNNGEEDEEKKCPVQ